MLRGSRINLFVDLAELAEAVAVWADDLGLVLPGRVRTQRRAALADEPGAVALRATDFFFFYPSAISTQNQID